MVALALVPPHHLVDVVGHDLDQRGVVEAAVGHPAGQLRVPDQCVAADVLPVLPRPVHVVVGGAPVELVAVGLDRVPLLRVLGRDGAELAADDVGLLVVVADREGRADVLAPGGNHRGIERLHLAVEEAGPCVSTALGSTTR